MSFPSLPGTRFYTLATCPVFGEHLTDKTMGQRILKMEYRRFLRQVVQIPCQILQRGRRLLYRLLNVNDWTETLLSGVPSPKRVRYG